MQGSQLSEAITQLDCIKKKIHKIKTHNEKFQNNVKLCPFPPGFRNTSQNLTPIMLQIPIASLKNKDTILEELILWDFEDDYSDEQLFRNLFSLVTDLLEEKYPNRVRKLTASETQKIIEDCLSQIKQAIEHHKQFKHISDILAFESYIDKNDSMINLQISTSKVAETIQWDLDNAFQYIDEFAYTYCYENKLGQENIVQIGNQIREQIQKAFEKRYNLISKLILEERQDFKQKLLSLLDYPSFEPYQSIKEIPSNNELNAFFKKNLDLLPSEFQILYGQRPIQKQMNDLYVDQEDTKKFEKELNQKSKYFDNVIVQDLLNRTKQT
ncbi:unnamed protein product (macronuclear) [Paramecium tetraurelia]|uniref:Uncharacterized protein n=1 Tax=Paramecium tetraurelia TaxID=5888 RepID=A0BCC9_PARTE|nr:uncharacterized protein GSPATT00004290001 [Paramecium tetraurelia]CAK56196.1 unnamed protein product [Paramecium tetraurelia]|eukprot:XP_001423594.1 hypothetical protein (macronuclear) [Paramecium tetraurelia strain d4-2]